ncbi:hypothetical protein BpHYR1_022153 [Brachionus plicatilis]|uniref:Uncharacterized protein n=1 Tax=Brachionus plicatilis TaxID=10195 RepID=A0A3M7SK81_BRAPC|nr:hypothetical protein BpHYR1_022153 [Brachionus plicatilis]
MLKKVNTSKAKIQKKIRPLKNIFKPDFLKQFLIMNIQIHFAKTKIVVVGKITATRMTSKGSYLLSHHFLFHKPCQFIS